MPTVPQFHGPNFNYKISFTANFITTADTTSNAWSTLTTATAATYYQFEPLVKALTPADKAKITRAKNKARKLLLMHLNIRQTKDFEKTGAFFVISNNGNLYQIRTGRSRNVRLIDPLTGKPMLTLCAHPKLEVPDFDTMLAQKLMLEFDEDEFVKIAFLSVPVGAVHYPEWMAA